MDFKMKYLFSILAIVISSSSFAQGDLQFNQVINYENSIYCSNNSCVFGTVTVPAGKVWKIESCSYSAFGYPISGSAGQSVFINGNTIYSVINTNTNYFPLWLGSGTYSVTGRLLVTELIQSRSQPLNLI